MSFMIEPDKSLKYIIDDLTNENNEEFDFFASLIKDRYRIKNIIQKFVFNGFLNCRTATI